LKKNGSLRGGKQEKYVYKEMKLKKLRKHKGKKNSYSRMHKLKKSAN